jgi:hypothetical protein
VENNDALTYPFSELNDYYTIGAGVTKTFQFEITFFCLCSLHMLSLYYLIV